MHPFTAHNIKFSLISLEKRDFLSKAREYGCSGIVTFNPITCRPLVYPTVEMERILDEEFGIPSVPFECDRVDERTYSKTQTLAWFDAFAERLLKMEPVFS